MLQAHMPLPPRHAEPPPPDDAALDEIAALKPVIRGVAAYVLGVGRDTADVEDCVHETFRRGLEGRARLREGEPLRPWLLGIARHVALDARRRRNRDRRSVGPSTNEDGEERSAVDALVDQGPTPEAHAGLSERARCVTNAMASLAEPQRRALLLFHVEGQAYDRIAEELGVPMGTVATWLARGRRALAEALRDADEWGKR